MKTVVRELKIWICFIFGGHTYKVNVETGTACDCGLKWDDKHPTDWRIYS